MENERCFLPFFLFVKTFSATSLYADEAGMILIRMQGRMISHSDISYDTICLLGGRRFYHEVVEVFVQMIDIRVALIALENMLLTLATLHCMHERTKGSWILAHSPLYVI